jgi:hypothetical protein
MKKTIVQEYLSNAVVRYYLIIFFNRRGALSLCDLHVQKLKRGDPIEILEMQITL